MKLKGIGVLVSLTKGLYSRQTSRRSEVVECISHPKPPELKQLEMYPRNYEVNLEAIFHLIDFQEMRRLRR